MFAVAAVLPLQLNLRTVSAGKVQFAQNVTAVFTLDRILSRGEESSFVLRTKYSHFACSLRGCFRLQAITCSTHKPRPSSGISFAATALIRKSLTDALFADAILSNLGERLAAGAAGVSGDAARSCEN